MLTDSFIDLHASRIALRKQIEKQANALQGQARVENIKITQRKRARYLYAITALKNIVLEPFFIKAFKAEFKSLKTYESQIINELDSLVIAHGGLNRTILQVEEFLAIRGLWTTNYDEIDYADEVLQSLWKVRSLTPQYKEKTYWNTVLPTCALCWRLPQSSHYYCSEHHPNRDQKSYKAAKHKVFRALTQLDNIYIESKSEKHKEAGSNSQKASNLYRLLGGFAPHPRYFIKFCKNYVLQATWIELAKSITTTTQELYPATFNCIKRIKPQDYSCWKNWCVAIIRALDPLQPKAWVVREQDKHLINVESWMAIVSTLHRYECTHRYESLPVNFGPEKGYRRNEEQCSSIKQLIDMQRLETGKVNLSEIARTLGLSRQRIHKIVNTYGLLVKK